MFFRPFSTFSRKILLGYKNRDLCRGNPLFYPQLRAFATPVAKRNPPFFLSYLTRIPSFEPFPTAIRLLGGGFPRPRYSRFHFRILYYTQKLRESCTLFRSFLNYSYILFTCKVASNSLYFSFANEISPTVIIVAVPAATPARKISFNGAPFSN